MIRATQIVYILPFFIQILAITTNALNVVSSNCTEFNPCKNMADCVKFEGETTRVKCICQRGFSGNLCEICNLLPFRNDNIIRSYKHS